GGGGPRGRAGPAAGSPGRSRSEGAPGPPRRPAWVKPLVGMRYGRRMPRAGPRCQTRRRGPGARPSARAAPQLLEALAEGLVAGLEGEGGLEVAERRGGVGALEAWRG